VSFYEAAVMIYGFNDLTLDQNRHELRCAGQMVSVSAPVRLALCGDGRRVADAVALAAVALASAREWTDHSGTICKNFNAGEVAYIDYFTTVTGRLKSGATQVIWPLTQNTESTYGAGEEDTIVGLFD
jgi:hypothetical protein